MAFLQPHEHFLAIAPNLPEQPRQAEADHLLPGLGEVSAFTDVGGVFGKNEDAFGIGGNGVLIVADGVSASRDAEKASADAVQVVLSETKDEDANLGRAFLQADHRIRNSGYDGETVASGVRINRDGTVDAAIAGDVEIWIYLHKPEGGYKLIPYASFFGDAPNVDLGGRKIPEIVEGGEVGGKNQILVFRLRRKNSEGSFTEDLLKLEDGEGVLLMGDGVAKFYNYFPSQLEELFTGQTSARGIRRAIQSDVSGRLETLKWRQGLQYEGRSLSWRHRVKIPESMPMSGYYIRGNGDVFANKHESIDEEFTAWFGEEDNQTALVFMRRSK